MIGYSRAFNELYGPKSIEGKSKMNERIRELFQEAIDYADNTHTYTPEEGFNIQVWDKIRFEKFAELIVRECIIICEKVEQVDNVKIRAGATFCREDIKEHFGIEL